MKTFKKFLKNYNEWLLIPLAVLLFLKFSTLVYYFDQEAGSFDTGYLHALIFGLVCVLFASGTAWLMLWLSFPDLYKFWDDEAEEVLTTGSMDEVHARTEAVKLAFKLYAMYFLGILLMTAIVLIA